MDNFGRRYGRDVLAVQGKDWEWRKSSWCEAGACVEVAVQTDVILLRKSTDPDGPVLVFTQAAWRELIGSVKQLP